VAVIISHQDDTPEELAVIELTTGEATTLAQAGTYLASPAWTPDSQEIIFTGSEGIYRIASSGGEAQLFLDEFLVTFAAMTPDISPDGRKLAYKTNGGSMKLVDLTTNEIDDTEIFASSPRFAPDGVALAYIKDDGIVIDRNGDEVSHSLALALLAEIAWFPDSTRLAYTSDEGIAILDTATGEHYLHHDAFAAIDLDVSPDGATIIYAVNGQKSLFSIDAP
jgi:Tol biopolymer transport system component